MPHKSISNPSFIRPAELMGEDIQKALSSKADEVADLIVKSLGSKTNKPLAAARKVVGDIYKAEGLDVTNRSRLVRIMNRGADEVSGSSVLKRQRVRLDGILDNVGGVVEKSAERYIDRIVLNKVARVLGNGGGPEDVRAAVKKSMDDAEHYWKNVSNTATSRMFHYGSMLAAQEAGLTKCTYHAVRDERTTDFCKSIDGKTITLANAIVKAEDILSGSSDDMLSSGYWDAVNELAASKSTAIVKNGLTLPPFHGHCRTTTWFS